MYGRLLEQTRAKLTKRGRVQRPLSVKSPAWGRGPRQGTKKEAGLDLLIMCRRGCQPGNKYSVPLLLPLQQED